MSHTFLSLFSGASKEVDNNRDYDVIYLDLNRHFVKAPHERLIKRVEPQGVGLNLG